MRHTKKTLICLSCCTVFFSAGQQLSHLQHPLETPTQGCSSQPFLALHWLALQDLEPRQQQVQTKENPSLKETIHLNPACLSNLDVANRARAHSSFELGKQ